MIVLIDVPDQIIIERLTKRRLDPATGEQFNNPDEITDIDRRKRLIIAPNEN